MCKDFSFRDQFCYCHISVWSERLLRRRCLSADGTTQTAKSSSNSFTELLDVYTMTPSSPSPPDAVSTTHHEVLGRKRLVRISSDRYQVRAAPDLPPGPFQSNPVGDIRSSLLRTMSERRGSGYQLMWRHSYVHCYWFKHLKLVRCRRRLQHLSSWWRGKSHCLAWVLMLPFGLFYSARVPEWFGSDA